MITIFTAPKAFQGKIGRIQRNAVWSWLALGPEVEVLLVGQEEGMARAAAELGVPMLPEVERNAEGTPLISSIFASARQAARHDLLCYANADVLFFPDLLEGARRVRQSFEHFLLVGQRWDLTVERQWHLEDFTEGGMREALLAQARPHPRTGSDYFLFPATEFQDLPPFALGRAGWDNWMIYKGRAAGIPVVDGSEAITVIHQDHDYGHLPGGQVHYRLPESERNVELAGGRAMIFSLADTTWRLSPEALEPKPWLGPGLFRRLEASLYTVLGPGKPARLARLLLHPVQTLRYLRDRLRRDEAVESGQHAAEAPRGPMIKSETPNRSDTHEI